MNTLAIVIDRPEHLMLSRLHLPKLQDEDVVVEVEWSGISTGTERLLWRGQMPSFPGMGYPLVPGYESFGEVVEARGESGLAVGDHVFVPGANCFGDGVRGLFGGASALLVTPATRVAKLDAGHGERGALLALAAHGRLGQLSGAHPVCRLQQMSPPGRRPAGVAGAGC